MGVERHGEDPYEGPRCSPKLILVGRIAGTVDGRPWLLSGDERALTLELPTLSVALKLRSTFSRLPAGLTRVSSMIKVPLKVRVGRLPAVTFGPQSFLLRLLLPSWSAARKAV